MAEPTKHLFLSSSSTAPTKSQNKVKTKFLDQGTSLVSAPPITATETTTPTVSPSTSPRLSTPTLLGRDSSDTETEMSSHSSKYPQDSSSKKHSSKSKAKPKNDNWTEISEPEERRRIQNRIAQRKFREKQKEHKERVERDDRNQQNAGSIYQVPDAGSLGPEDEQLSGLPWGSINMNFIVARGHESEVRRGSARDNQTHDSSAQYCNTLSGYNQQQTASWGSRGSRGSSGGDDRYQDDQQAYYQDDQAYYHDYEYDQDHDHGYDYDYDPRDGSSYQT
ncbi:hypothetical protein F5Y19DRAFT_287495 [Xylariaceae sp. FL1651]|nr:hypothetical protein F5Y19DRAFT_287495 [Xylariaceae sp. FL1651]